MRQSIFLGTFCLLAMTAGVRAEGSFTVGLLAEGQTGVYAGEGDTVDALPYLSYEARHFEVSLHDGIAFHALRGEGDNGASARVSLVLAPRWAPDFGHGAVVEGLDRDTAIEAGLRGRYEAGGFFVEGEVLADVSDTHGGHEASAFVGLEREVGAWQVEGGLGLRYRSDKLNQYLYGVRADEATATRAAFAPGDSTTGFATATAAYALGRGAVLVGEVSFEDLGDMDQSPLVAKGAKTSLTLGVLFQF